MLHRTRHTDLALPIWVIESSVCPVQAQFIARKPKDERQNVPNNELGFFLIDNELVVFNLVAHFTDGL